MENGVVNGVVAHSSLKMARAKRADQSPNVRALKMAIEAVAQGFGYEVKDVLLFDSAFRIGWAFCKPGDPKAPTLSFHCDPECGPLIAIVDCIMNFRRAGEAPLNG
jgi:hypothetical protein